jgi:hypothetical protein
MALRIAIGEYSDNLPKLPRAGSGPSPRGIFKILCSFEHLFHDYYI